MSLFRINRKTDYAVRVVLFLAMQPLGVRLSSREVQKQTLVPKAYLQRIIAQLSQAGLIETFPGPNGGLQLAHFPDKITLRQIIEVMDGPIWVSDCLKEKEICPLSEDCPVRGHWGRLQALIIRELDQTTMAQLASEAALDNDVEVLQPLPLVVEVAQGVES